MDYELFKLVVHKAERSNCFSINLLIGQKDVQLKISMKSSDIKAKRGSLLFWSAIFSLLVGYHK